jgi:Protein of unknown function (DUF4238)
MNRAQHFVPQLYLRPFHDPSLANEHVWVYEKGKSPRHAAVKKVAHQRDFYSFLHEGERNNLVDEYFQSLEGDRAGARLRQLAETGRLSQEDKEFLAKFIGVMSARVPVARILADDIAGEKLTEELSKYVNDPELFEQQFKAVRLDPPMKSETVRQMLLQGYRFQQADDFYNLQMMLDMAQLNYEGLLDMDWIVWCASGDLQFITSDNPVVSILPQGGGEARLGRSFSIPEIQIIFPLSPSACLFARRGVAAGLRTVPNTRVRQVNKVLMGMAHRWIFAAENSSKIAHLFDRIGGTGGYGNDFYEYRPEIFQHKKSRREGEAQTSTALDET